MKKTKLPDFDGFFSSASKLLLLFPLVILILGLYVKFAGSQAVKTATVENKTQLSVSPTSQPPAANNLKLSIDLKGPYHCVYRTAEADMSAYIKQGQVLLTVTPVKSGTKPSRYFFDGDCFYVDGEKKQCGLKMYVGLLQSTFGSNFAAMQKMAGSYLKTDFDLGKFMATCKKEEFGEDVFN